MITRTIAFVALLAALGLLPRAVRADSADPCYVPARIASSEMTLPVVAERVRNKQPLTIAVLGSASSAGAGIGGALQAYPSRLRAELAQRFPGIPVTVDNFSKRGLAASEMAGIIVQRVVPARPALVIWQTGTVEAVRGADIRELGASLVAGIEVLRRTPADVILMTPQFSPRTAAMIDLARYADYMERIAGVSGTGLLDRHEIMRYWTEEGLIAFDSPTPAEQERLVDRIHGCLARLLADRIEAAAAAAPAAVATPPAAPAR